VFVRVPYSRLAFVREGEKFVSSYEISLQLVDPSGNVTEEKNWTENPSVATFDESVSSRNYSLTQQVFDVPSGSYSLLTVVRDLEVGTPLRLSIDVLVSDFSSTPFSLSGIMLVSRISRDGEKRTIVPHVSSNVGSLDDGFHAYLEAYNDDSLANIRLTTSVLDWRGESVFHEESVQSIVPGRNRIFVAVENKNLTMGDYILKVQAFADGAEASKGMLGESTRAFVVRWFGVPMAVKDLDLAIQQTQYIANPGELDLMQEAPTPEEKRSRFVEFWKKRDPNPNTPRNEKMEEYYAKVEYANKHFAHYIDGWRTDMGMVYIIFGAPNNVDRHPFDHDSKPYEVWSYYDLNHQFVFVDESGFGDYRLTTPIWEVWQRPK
jgi:GWxTD domain-containing protein